MYQTDDLHQKAQMLRNAYFDKANKLQRSKRKGDVHLANALMYVGIAIDAILDTLDGNKVYVTELEIRQLVNETVAEYRK